MPRSKSKSPKKQKIDVDDKSMISALKKMKKEEEQENFMQHLLLEEADQWLFAF